MERKCAICDLNAPKSCSACLSVAYCSAEHQKEHWKIHRNDCKCYRVVDYPDRELGKGIVATRDLKEGTIILEEAPVVFSANWDTPSCITCGLILSPAKYRRCPTCAWPVCSLDCAKLTVHAENECQLFASKSFRCPPPFLPRLKELCLVIGMIRALYLKKKQPETFQRLVELCSDYQLPDVGQLSQERLELLMPVLQPLELDQDDSEMKKVCRVLDINSYNGTDCYGGNEHTTACMYLEASRINHSCLPNCTWTNSPAPDFKIRVRTAIAVKRGGPLTVAYYSWEALGGTRNRQEKLLKSGFRCKCVRCLDPTELGTYASAVGCRSCRPTGQNPIGYFLPENPLDLSENASWKCNSCGSTKLASDVLGPIGDFGKIVSQEHHEAQNFDSSSSAEYCKSLVKLSSEKLLLHPNHWVIQNAKKAFVDYTVHRRYGVERHQGLEIAVSNYFIKCGMDLLAIQDVVSPGSSNYRASLQVELGCALQAQGKYLLVEKRSHEAIARLHQAIVHQKEGLKFCKGEFPKRDGKHLPGDNIIDNIKCASQELESILSKTVKTWSI